MIDELPSDKVKDMIFRKGLLHLLPEKVNQTLKNNYKQSNLREGKDDNQASLGSTRSDELFKNLEQSSFSLGSAKDIDEEYRFEKPNESDDDIQEEPPKLKTRNSVTSVECSSELIQVHSDVKAKNFKEETKSNEEYIELEEEIVGEEFTKTEKVEPPMIDETYSINIQPICQSSNFKSGFDTRAHDNYFELLNLETVVLTSNRKELVGQQRTILNHQQLATMGCVITEQAKGRKFKYSKFILTRRPHV